MIIGNWQSSINIMQKDTVKCTINWMMWNPFLRFPHQWTSFWIITNPSVILLSKDNLGFSKDLVIERLGLGFKKSSFCESIQCCRFTEFLGISIFFFVRIEAVDNSYNSITVDLKSRTDSRKQWQQNYGFIWWCTGTSHSAYVAISTELHGVKIDRFLYPNLCRFQKCKRKVPLPSLPPVKNKK